MAQQAVVNVTDTAAFDTVLPSPTGPFARVLGPTEEKTGNCPICKKPAGHCYGHYGVLDIQDAPKFHPEFWSWIMTVLGNVCFYDYVLLIRPPEEKETAMSFKLTVTRRDAIEHARDLIYGEEARSLSDDARFLRVSRVLKPYPTCEKCGRRQPKLKVQKGSGQLVVTEYAAEDIDQKLPPRVLKPIEVRGILEKISKDTYRTMGVPSGICHPAWTVLSLLTHPPNCLFPPKTSGGKVAPDYMQSHLMEIVNFAQKEAAARAAGEDDKERDAAFIGQAKIRQYISESAVQTASQMQFASHRGKMRRNKVKRKRHATAKRERKDQPMLSDETPVVPAAKATSTRKMLDDKNGHARAFMMGHINEEVARFVINGDPYLLLGHSGVPALMMQTLVKPIRIWYYNLRMAQRLVDLGPTHPFGARSIIQYDGHRKMLDFIPDQNVPFSDRTLQAAARQHRPRERYLLTLSRRAGRPAPSAKRAAGRVEVRPGQILERHFGVVTSTAGQNVHDRYIEGRQPSAGEAAIQCMKAVPRPRSKCLSVQVTEAEKAHADLDGDEKHAENPQNLRAEVEAEDLMAADLFNVCSMDNSNYTRLIQGGVLGIYDLTAPDTVLTAEEMMQYMMLLDNDNTALLPEPQRVSKDGSTPLWTGAQLFSLFLPRGFDYELYAGDEAKHLLIRDGQLIKGQVTGDAVGKSEHSIIVKMWHYWPRHVHTDFVYRAQLLGCTFATDRGASTGISDLMDILARSDNDIKGAIAKLDADASQTVTEKSGQLAALLSQLHKATLEKKSEKPTTLERMVHSKARGKLLNVSQMVNVVGQQTRDGSSWLHGRPTPHFLQSEMATSLCANGFIGSSFLSGMNDLQYFAAAQVAREHAIAAKRGVPDSGYACRRIASTGCDYIVKYDFTVRNSKGHIASFRFGGDGVNPRHAKRSVVSKFSPYDSLGLEPTDREALHGWFDKWEKRPDKTSLSLAVNDLISAFARPLKDFVHTTPLTDMDMRPRICRLSHLLALPHTVVSRKDARRLVDTCYDLPESVSQFMATSRFRDEDTTQLNRIRMTRDIYASPLRFNVERWNAFAVAMLNEHWRSLAEPGLAVGASLGPSITNRLLQTAMDAEKTAGQNQVTAAQGLPLAMEILGASKPRMPSVTVSVSSVCRNCRFRAQVVTCPHVNIAAAKKHLVSSLQGVTLTSLGAELSVRTQPADDTKPFLPQDVPLMLHTGAVKFASLSSVFLNVMIKRRSVADKDHHERCAQLIQIVTSKLLADDKRPFAGMQVVDTHQYITDASRRAACHEYVARIYFMLPDDKEEKKDDLVKTRNYFAALLPRLRHLVLTGESKITKATVSPGGTDPKVVLGGKGGTSGPKFWFLAKLMARPDVAGKGCFSNTIHEVARVIGIEAARQHQFNRLIDVFRASGEFLDMRYPDLAVDIMTRHGFVSPFTKALLRSSIDIKEAGACVRGSFESNQANFMQAARRGEVDLIRDPSACIMMGKRSPVGTGAFSMTMDLDMLEKQGRKQRWCHQPIPRLDDEMLANMAGLGVDDPFAGLGGDNDTVMSAMDELMKQAPPPDEKRASNHKDLLEVKRHVPVPMDLTEEVYDPDRPAYDGGGGGGAASFSPSQSPSSPVPRSPTYDPADPGYTPQSPTASSSSYVPRSPTYDPGYMSPAPVQYMPAPAAFAAGGDEDGDEAMYSPELDAEEIEMLRRT